MWAQGNGSRSDAREATSHSYGPYCLFNSPPFDKLSANLWVKSPVAIASAYAYWTTLGHPQGESENQRQASLNRPNES